ncbi:MAG TPA: sulfite exporter TauE/SafE family protein [Oligoflexia bacterium]|nr:sulfite exporter TauE/SafE family protein [Oligoflexia bacterium]
MENFGLIISVIGFAFMGTMLGLLGAGGSILSVPLLIYVIGLTPVVATSYSLVIVAFCAAVALLTYLKAGLVDFKVAAVFAPLTVAGVWFARKILLPAVPDSIALLGTSVSKDVVILTVFGLVMLRAAWVMLVPKTKNKSPILQKNRTLLFIITGVRGLFLGVLTGFVGAGGGFMLVPAIHQWFRLPMDRAIGTSLVVIVTNASLGAIFSIHHFELPMFWKLSGLLLAATAGIYLGGTVLRKKIDPKSLRPVFGWMIVIIAVYVLYDGISKILR